MNFNDGLLYLVILIFSVVIHEVAHGYAARKNGDETATMAGRLTLNPISHIDLFGSIILPAILLMTGSRILLGWAKPVPVNTNNFTDQKKGILQVSLAGILANFGLAIIFGVFTRLAIAMHLPVTAISALALVVLVNIVLGFFNLIPIPPLDGSKVLFVLLPRKFAKFESFMNQYALVIMIVFIFFGANYILQPLVKISFTLLTGTSL